LTSRVFLSLERNEAPEDFKSLNRGEISLFENWFEKFDKGDGFEISLRVEDEFNHLEFKNVFLFHFEFKVDLRGLWLWLESFSA
jgi:preprotein translocase subunit SecB